MTEAAFQAARKLMQKANYLRGMITNAEGKVAKWTAIEVSHRRNLREGQANGAKKALEQSLLNLEKWRERFRELRFPDADMKEQAAVHTCKQCGEPVSRYDEYCGQCESSAVSKSKAKEFMRKMEQKQKTIINDGNSN